MAYAKRDSPVTTFDFTLEALRGFEGETDEDRDKFVDQEVESIKQWLEEIARSWAFQLEFGEENGWLHYQGRFVLKVKTRLSTMINRNFWDGYVHYGVTSNANRGNMFYVMKEESRIDGPWTDKDIKLPWQLALVKDWRPWQQKIVDLLTKKDARSIHLVYEPEGGVGKTTLVNLLGATGKIAQIPFCNDYRDIMRMAMAQYKLGAFFIDLPRALKKDKLRQMYSGIETIKGGYAFDDRYSYKSVYFDSPQIVVFTNELPEKSFLSEDRWKVWTVEESERLVPISIDGNPILEDSSKKINYDEVFNSVVNADGIPVQSIKAAEPPKMAETDNEIHRKAVDIAFEENEVLEAARQEHPLVLGATLDRIRSRRDWLEQLLNESYTPHQRALFWNTYLEMSEADLPSPACRGNASFRLEAGWRGWHQAGLDAVVACPKNDVESNIIGKPA